MGKIIKGVQIFLFMLVWFCHAYGETKSFNDIFRLEGEFTLEVLGRFNIDRDGRIWICDGEESQRNVKIYNPQGELLKIIDLKNLKEYKDNFTYRVIPVHIAFDKDYRAYVLSLTGQIMVIDSSGEFLNYFATEQDLDCRGGFSIKIDKKGNVYVGGPCYQEVDICPETRNFCIHKYDPQGKYIKSFFPFEKKLLELTDYPDDWVFFDFDSEGNIWCVHAMVYQIFKYSPEGKFLAKFPGKSTLYKPPTKFSKKGPIFFHLMQKSQKAMLAWKKSWTQIINLIMVKPNFILLSLLSHTPSEYVIDIYDQEGNPVTTDIQTEHSLLWKDNKGYLYFLMDAPKARENKIYKIGRFSFNLK